MAESSVNNFLALTHQRLARGWTGRMCRLSSLWNDPGCRAQATRFGGACSTSWTTHLAGLFYNQSFEIHCKFKTRYFMLKDVFKANACISFLFITQK